MALPTTSYEYVRGKNVKKSKRGPNYYKCTAFSTKGPLACTNSLKIRRDIAEARIKETIREELFDHAAIARFKETLRGELLASGKGAPDEAVLLRKRDKELDRQRGHLLAAIKDGIWTVTTGDELRRMEAEQRDVRQRLAGIEAVAVRSMAKAVPALLDQTGDVISDLEVLEKKDVHLARRHLASLLGGVVHVFPGPAGNIVGQLQGHLLGLLEVLDAMGRLRFDIEKRVMPKKDQRHAVEFGHLIHRLRQIVEQRGDGGVYALENALKRRVDRRKADPRWDRYMSVSNSLVAEEGFEPPTQGL